MFYFISTNILNLGSSFNYVFLEKIPIIQIKLFWYKTIQRYSQKKNYFAMKPTSDLNVCVAHRDGVSKYRLGVCQVFPDSPLLLTSTCTDGDERCWLSDGIPRRYNAIMSLFFRLSSLFVSFIIVCIIK
jgi:hypothetical protein